MSAEAFFLFSHAPADFTGEVTVCFFFLSLSMYQHGERLRNVYGTPQIEEAQRSYLLERLDA